MYSVFLAIPFVVLTLGMKTPKSEVNSIEFNSPTQQKKAGEKVFKKYCASCHQLDGGGVPNLAPPLIGTKYVLGDKIRLINILLNGFNEDVEIDNEHFSNPMPPFESKLTNKDIANVLTFVRSSFGNKASAVTPAEVEAVRAGK